MKKIAILLTLLCAFSDVCGVYSAWSRERVSRKIGRRSIKQTTEASTSSSSVSKSVHKDITKRILKNYITTENSAEQIRIDAEIRKRIQNFAQNRRSNVYNAEQIEAALLECIPDLNHSKNASAKDSISLWTLARWASRLRLNVRYNDQKSEATKKKILKIINKDIEWKNIHKIIGKKRNSAINALGKLKDKGLIRITLEEEKKNKLIQDFREKLITHKGLARKYNIKESEVYCIIHEARKNKKDISRIKMTWKITYKNRQALSEKQKRKIIKDYNKGLLTLQGICVKHGISQKVAQSVIYENDDSTIKRRNGKQRKRNTELVLDVLTKSSQEIERKYGYTSVYVDELKRFVNQWNLLTEDQKDVFSYTVLSGVMPPENVLSFIKRSLNRNANEKFDKILFVSISTCEEVMAKYNILRRSVNRLIREMEFWKILSGEEQRKKFLLKFEKNDK